MMTHIVRIAPLFFLSLLLVSCGQSETPAASSGASIIKAEKVSISTGSFQSSQEFVGKVVGLSEITLTAQTSGVVSSVSALLGDRVAKDQTLLSLDGRTTTTNIALQNAESALQNAISANSSTLKSLEADLISAQVQLQNAVSSRDEVYKSSDAQLSLATLSSKNSIAQAKTNLEQAELSLKNFETNKAETLSSLADRRVNLDKTAQASLLQVVSTLEPALDAADKVIGATEKNKAANDGYEPFLGAKSPQSLERTRDQFFAASRELDGYKSVIWADLSTRLRQAQAANTAAVELYRQLSLLINASVIDVTRFSQAQVDALSAQVSQRQQALLPLESQITQLVNSARDLSTQESTTKASLETQRISLSQSLDIARRQLGYVQDPNAGATIQEISEKNLETTKAQVSQARSSADNALNLAKAQVESLSAKIAAQRAQSAQSLDQARSSRDIAAVSAYNGSFRSPVAGVITERLVEPGMVISVGTPLLSIASGDTKIIRLDIPSTLRDTLKISQDVTIKTQELTASGKVSRIAPAPDAKTGLYRVDIVSDQSKNFTYGQTYSVSWQEAFTAEISSDASVKIVLPLSAVTPRSAGVYEVWVLVADRVSRREVTTGRVNAESIEIVKGLTPQDIVVAPKSEFYEGALVKLP